MPLKFRIPSTSSGCLLSTWKLDRRRSTFGSRARTISLWATHWQELIATMSYSENSSRRLLGTASAESWIWLSTGEQHSPYVHGHKARGGGGVVSDRCPVFPFIENNVLLKSHNEDVTESIRSLTELEKGLFNSGLKTSVAFSRWKERKSKVIRVSHAATQPGVKKARR